VERLARREARDALFAPPENLHPGVDEGAKIAGGNTARVYNFHVAKLTAPA
jgi:hypothetical protein